MSVLLDITLPMCRESDDAVQCAVHQDQLEAGARRPHVEQSGRGATAAMTS